jgi:hypothetical protein
LVSGGDTASRIAMAEYVMASPPHPSVQERCLPTVHVFSGAAAVALVRHNSGVKAAQERERHVSRHRFIPASKENSP